jgi:hypothetical protein
MDGSSLLGYYVFMRSVVRYDKFTFPALLFISVYFYTRTASANERNTARYEQRSRALADTDCAYVTHDKHPAAPRELRGRERAGSPSEHVRRLSAAT